MQCPNDFNHLQFNHQNVSEWIRFADSKATFFLTVTLTMVGISLTDVPSVTKVTIGAALSPGILPAAGIATLLLLHFVFYFHLCRAACFFIAAVNPRLDRRSRTHSWYFFDSMARLTIEDFRTFVDNQDAETLKTQLTDEIFNNCQIAQAKFLCVSKGVKSLTWASIFGVIAVTPTLVVVTAFSA